MRVLLVAELIDLTLDRDTAGGDFVDAGMFVAHRVQAVFGRRLRFAQELRRAEILVIGLARQCRPADEKAHQDSFANSRSIATIERVNALTPSCKSAGAVYSLPM